MFNIHLNPVTIGGGDVFHPPLCFFLNDLKTNDKRTSLFQLHKYEINVFEPSLMCQTDN